MRRRILEFPIVNIFCEWMRILMHFLMLFYIIQPSVDFTVAFGYLMMCGNLVGFSTLCRAISCTAVYIYIYIYIYICIYTASKLPLSNSLAPEMWFFKVILKMLIFSLALILGFSKSSDDNYLRWMPEDFTDVNIGSGNGLVPSGNKPLSEPVLTKISNAIWRH